VTPIEQSPAERAYWRGFREDNVARKRELYVEAAKQGHVVAMYGLSVLEQGTAQSRLWLLQAAARGFWAAIHDLASLDGLSQQERREWHKMTVEVWYGNGHVGRAQAQEELNRLGLQDLGDVAALPAPPSPPGPRAPSACR